MTLSGPASSKVAVVSGGAAGIGRGVALALADAGWDVAVSFLHDSDANDTLSEQIARRGRRFWGCRCDVGLSEDVDEFYSGFLREFHRAPDLLVNNAGVQTWSSLVDLPEARWDQVLRTNLKGAFLNLQKVAKLLIAEGRRGAIINIGSGCNKVPFPNLVDYSASKGGIEMLTKVAAIELGQYGITVNCVAPGAIEIERTRAETPDYAQTWSRATPIGRVGRPEDVAHAVLFFADEKSDFITGQTLWVDGGMFTKPNWPY
jgi:NAD(P)-dependent dehydrogenase (short-subunit alcohol dehydrogenase family)